MNGICDYEGCSDEADVDAETTVTMTDGTVIRKDREYCGTHALTLIEAAAGLPAAGEALSVDQHGISSRITPTVSDAENSK